MKKALLTLAAAAMCSAAAWAAAPVLDVKVKTPVTFGDVPDTYAPSYNNPTVYSNGNLYVAGGFNGTITVKDITLTSETTSQNAYIIKFDPQATASWAVGVTGSATVTSLTADADGNLYAAGTFADEVTFTSTDGNDQTRTGRMVEGAAVEKQVSSFIAKYDSDGKLLAVVDFIPAKLAEIANETGGLMDLTETGDTFFRITKIQADGEKLYAAAIFNGETNVGGVTLKGSYASVWSFMITNVDCAAVFSLDTATLTSAAVVNQLTDSNPGEDKEFVSGADSATLAVVNGTVYSGYTCVGNMAVGGNKLTLAQGTEGYILASSASSGVISVEKPNNTTSVQGRVSLSSIVSDGTTLYAIGTYPVPVDGDAVAGDGIAVLTVNASDFTLASSKEYELNEGSALGEGKPNYGVAASAAVVGDDLFINTRTYNYNQETLSPASYWLSGGALTKSETTLTGIQCVYEWGSNFIYFASSDATGVTYGFAMPKAAQVAIDTIGADAVDAAGSPVEYYTLQGMRVASPQAGLYIRRQGDKVEKVIVK